MPKLSIIIPTFNSAGTIQRCLLSIQTQTFTDYEIVLQDGGSSDRTVELIRELGQEYPGLRIELEREPDKGVYDAMNKAMRRATGEWLYFLGSDDELYDRNVLDKVLGDRKAAGCDVLYGSVKVIGSGGWVPDGTIYDGRFDLRKLLRTNLCHQAIFYKASFARGVGEYHLKYAVLADWDFNMRCWAKGRFKHVNVIVAKYYLGGISSQPDQQFMADMAANVTRYFGKKGEEARRAPRFTPRRMLGAIVRKLGIKRYVERRRLTG